MVRRLNDDEAELLQHRTGITAGQLRSMMCLAPGQEDGELREHPTRYLPNWKSAGPRVVRRILAASDPQLTLKARLRHGTATAEPAVPYLSEAAIVVRASKTPGMLNRPARSRAPHAPLGRAHPGHPSARRSTRG